MSIDMELFFKEKPADWEKSIESAYNILSNQSMDDEEFLFLLNACTKKEQLDLLAKEFFLFTKHDARGRSAGRFFLHEIDDSDYSLEQWVQALEMIYAWFKEKKLSANFEDVIGYLNCCTQSPENHLFQQEFVDIAKEMLEEHGFEKAVEVVD